MLLAEKDFAKAITAAAVADFAAAPNLQDAIASGVIGARKLRDMMLRAAESEVSGFPDVPTFPNLRKLIRSWVQVESGSRASGMGAPAPAPATDYSWISSAFSAVTTIANTYVNYKTGKELVEIEKEKAAAATRTQEILARQAELDAANARLIYSKQAEAEARAESEGGPLKIPGVPGWVVPGVGALAIIGGILAFRR